MLIDSSHKPWAWATVLIGAGAAGVYAWADYRSPDGLTGGTSLGLWYGVFGSLLMIFAGLLSALRRVPAWWWIGSRRVWLKGHIWLSLLSVVFILCHSGFRWGGWLERALWVVFGLTILTGIAGLLLQQFLPRLLRARFPSEAPYEQIPHRCLLLRLRADGLLRQVWDSHTSVAKESVVVSQMGEGAKMQLQKLFYEQVWPFLSQQRPPRRATLSDPVKAEVAFSRLRALPGLADVKEQVLELEALCTERRLLAEQERLYHWLHSWLLVHIPLSAALLILGVAHAVASLYY